MKTAVDVAFDVILVIARFCTFIARLGCCGWLLFCGIRWLWQCYVLSSIAEADVLLLPLLWLIVASTADYILGDMHRHVRGHLAVIDGAEAR